MYSDFASSGLPDMTWPELARPECIQHERFSLGLLDQVQARVVSKQRILLGETADQNCGARTRAIDRKRDFLFAVNGLCTFFLLL